MQKWRFSNRQGITGRPHWQGWGLPLIMLLWACSVAQPWQLELCLKGSIGNHILAFSIPCHYMQLCVMIKSHLISQIKWNPITGCEGIWVYRGRLWGQYNLPCALVDGIYRDTGKGYPDTLRRLHSLDSLHSAIHWIQWSNLQFSHLPYEIVLL